MNIYTLSNYVNLDIDDAFSVEEIAQWFNKGIANYNLIPPLTKYKLVSVDTVDEDNNEYVDAYENYSAMTDNFMLGIMLPFINSAIRGQDASVQEKQIYLEEFLNNARLFKQNHKITDTNLLFDSSAEGLDIYRLGENVFLSDMRMSPFQANWGTASEFVEIVSEDTTSGIAEGDPLDQG